MTMTVPRATDRLARKARAADQIGALLGATEEWDSSLLEAIAEIIHDAVPDLPHPGSPAPAAREFWTVMADSLHITHK